MIALKVMPFDTGALAAVALQVPSLLLPREDVPLGTWAVVACDQYTSQPEYWQRVAEACAGKPSTLGLILPEVDLAAPDVGDRIGRINATMAAYLADGVLVEEAPGVMLVERTTHGARVRRGLVVAMDLERYDFRPGAASLIRATEGTILERLPPRMQIRRHALLELPHIMVLIDDPQRTVIEPLFAEVAQQGLPPRYDFELMEGGGHLRGHHLSLPEALDGLAARLARLGTLEQMQAKYGTREQGVFLYAVGDGNHSLATAKAIWEDVKAGRDAASVGAHPARHALVELVNVHDAGLVFEPIHRVLFGIDPNTFLATMDAYFRNKDPGYSRTTGGPELVKRTRQARSGETLITCVTAQGYALLAFRTPPHTLAVGTLQAFLDAYLEERSGVSIDYVHGEAVVRTLGASPGHAGFFLPPLVKQDLFRTVMCEGALPRKAFSMGDAEEKRFYMEARKIRP